jgi:peptidyl-prolyl cis-trans isomerase C
MKWYREPLVHFLLAGLALFAVYGGFRASPQGEEPRRIEITADNIRRLGIAWAARWQRFPTTLELRGLIEDQVREEILYREALALGLAQGDTIVKRWLAQKMDFLAEDVAALRDPSPEDLTAWFENNPRRAGHHRRRPQGQECRGTE